MLKELFFAVGVLGSAKIKQVEQDNGKEEGANHKRLTRLSAPNPLKFALISSFGADHKATTFDLRPLAISQVSGA